METPRPEESAPQQAPAPGPEATEPETTAEEPKTPTEEPETPAEEPEKKESGTTPVIDIPGPGADSEETEGPAPEDVDEELPWPEPPQRDIADNVVVLGNREETGPAVDEEPDEDEEGETGNGTEEEEKVLSFPETKIGRVPFIAKIGRRADRYAKGMFQDADEPESGRKKQSPEDLIPPVDHEEPEPEEATKVVLGSREETAPAGRKPAAPPPDTPPKELARQLQQGQKARHRHSQITGLIGVGLLVFYVLTLTVLRDQLTYTVQLVIEIVALAAAMGAEYRDIAECFVRNGKFRFGLETLVPIACFTTLADACVLLVNDTRNGVMPLCIVSIFSLYFLTHGTYLQRHGQRLACRIAASGKRPYRVTLDAKRWNNRDSYCKWDGDVTGFGSQIQMEDYASRSFRRAAPFLLAGAVVASAIVSFGFGRGESFLWSLSATLTGCASFSVTMVYGRTFAKLSKKLNSSGAAVAGWAGVQKEKKQEYILLTDSDLFPPGSVQLNGIKIFEGFSLERVVGYTATVIRDADSELSRVFYELLRTSGSTYRMASSLRFQEGSGYSANINGDSVLVGSASFMTLMQIEIPKGRHIRNAVFCAINGELAGLFALRYELPDVVRPSIRALLQDGIEPILATRDFNLTPAMLKNKFNLPTERMQYPPIDRRRDLSAPTSEHNETLTAVLGREGIGTYAEAVIGCHRLNRAVRIMTFLTLLGAVIGLALGAWLTGAQAYTALSPENMLIFQLCWLVPTYLFGNWVSRI